MSSHGQQPPVVLLGGAANAVSIVRSLSRHGIAVCVAAEEGSPALSSRHCAARFSLPAGDNAPGFFYDLLLGKRSDVAGSVVFPLSDEAIQFVAANRPELEKLYTLDNHTAELQLALLDKKKTIELARRAGVAAPKLWDISGVDDLARLEGLISFPAIIKPIHSHLFQRRFGVKLFPVGSFDELARRIREVERAGVAVMINELIPGPDELLSSYYTHIDADGAALFHYTKRVIRRSPINFGGACYHATEWLPETAEVGEQFFRGIGFTGLGNVEFKRDPRDGQLKLIECNARFTAAQELLVQSGVDIAYLIYLHLTGRPTPKVQQYRQNLRLWLPSADYDAFRELRRRGELTFPQWVQTLEPRPVFAYFSLSDPGPYITSTAAEARERLGRRLRQWKRSLTPPDGEEPPRRQDAKDLLRVRKS